MNHNEHLSTPLSFSGEIYDFSHFWAKWSKKQRMEVIKSLIYTAPDSYSFHQKVVKTLTSEAFKETLD